MRKAASSFLIVAVIGPCLFFGSCERPDRGTELRGRLDEIDSNEAARVTRRAESGDALAQYELGMRFANGNGVIADLEQASRWLGLAARQDLPQAQYALGMLAINGHSDARAESAVDWVRRAADQEHADAEFVMGLLHFQGRILPKDGAQSFLWVTKGARHGNRDAQHALGNIYMNGYCGQPKDVAKAVTWYEMAASQNHAGAQIELGALCSLGRGVQQDFEKAADLFRKAAEQGEPLAQFHLATCYYFGRGVSRDWGRSAEWARKAAMQDVRTAQCLMGKLQAQGEGVPKDDVLAVAWLTLGLRGHQSEELKAGDDLTRRGFSDTAISAMSREAAQRLLLECTARLTNDQLAAAERLSERLLLSQ